jgi:hypothetical protein
VNFDRRVGARAEEGSALVLALLFLTVSAVIIGGLLTYSNTSAASTSALRVSRNNDYDAQQTMDAAIAMVRTGTTCSSSGTTNVGPTSVQVPLNNAGRALRVDCFAPTASVVAGQRNYVLLVCPVAGSSTPCTDTQAVLSAFVTFYDSTSPPTINIQTWSNQ